MIKVEKILEKSRMEQKMFQFINMEEANMEEN